MIRIVLPINYIEWRSPIHHAYKLVCVSLCYFCIMNRSNCVRCIVPQDRECFRVWYSDFLDRSSTYIPLILYIFLSTRWSCSSIHILQAFKHCCFWIFLSLYIEFLYDLSRLLDRFLKSKMYEFELLRRYNLALMEYTWLKTSILRSTMSDVAHYLSKRVPDRLPR